MKQLCYFASTTMKSELVNSILNFFFFCKIAWIAFGLFLTFNLTALPPWVALRGVENSRRQCSQDHKKRNPSTTLR